MKYARSKKLTFFNNKGGVGKTTLAFNVAVEFAKKGYKTVLIDLDPQCNLTRLALGDEYYDNTIFSATSKTIYDILRGVIRGGADIDLDVQFEQAKAAPENLYLLRGDLRLSEYENILYWLQCCCCGSTIRILSDERNRSFFAREGHG